MNNYKNFKEKYLKYKQKYLELKSLIGGGFKNAETQFYAKLAGDKYINIRNILLQDSDYFRSNNINIEEVFPLNYIDPKTNFVAKDNYKKVINAIIGDPNDKRTYVGEENIELFVKLYLSGQLGNPNSLSNREEFKNNMIKLNTLNELYNYFETLDQIKEFIDENKDLLNRINLSNIIQSKKISFDINRFKAILNKIDISQILNDQALQLINLNQENNLANTPDIDSTLNFVSNDPDIIDKLYIKIINEVDPKYMELLSKIYLNGKLGDPNSLGNKNDFNKNMKYFTALSNLKDKLTSLNEIIEFVNKNEKWSNLIESKKKLKESISKSYATAKAEGEDKVDIIFNNNNILIVHPISKEGSIYYGSNTKWCTSATGTDEKGESKNKFDAYNAAGPMYTIIFKGKKFKDNIPLKYQMHVEAFQLMDPENEPVSLFKVFSDAGYNSSFIEKIYELINSRIQYDARLELPKEYRTNNIKLNDYFFYILNNAGPSKVDIGPKQIIIGRNIGRPLTQPKVKILSFDDDFNLPLDDFLNKFTAFNELEQIEFGNNFNQPLNNSLMGLNTLRRLHFKNNFDQPLGNSLDNLTNLQELSLGPNYKQSLTHLNNLRNLTSLAFNFKNYSTEDIENFISSNPGIRLFDISTIKY